MLVLLSLNSNLRGNYAQILPAPTSNRECRDACLTLLTGLYTLQKYNILSAFLNKGLVHSYSVYKCMSMCTGGYSLPVKNSENPAVSGVHGGIIIVVFIIIIINFATLAMVDVWILVHFQFCVHIGLADSHAGVGLLWLSYNILTQSNVGRKGLISSCRL